MLIPFQALSYELVATYVEGYLSGIGHAIGRNIVRNLHNWQCAQRREGIATVWVAYVPFLHEGTSDDELIGFLLSDVENYFKNNPNWQQEDIPYRWQFDEDEQV
jgi:hypothetical protein